MKTVQIPRGPTTQESTIVGAEGQLRFDVSRGTVRAHDGVTRGGFELPNVELVQQLIASGGAQGASGVIQYYGTEAELADAVPSANALAVVNEAGLEEVYTWKPGANDGGGISSNIDGYWRRTDSSVGFYVRLWRASIINMQINGAQPAVNQTITLWLTNGVAKIYDGANYEVATPALFARLMAYVGNYAIGAVVLPDRLLDTLQTVLNADAVTDSGWYKSSAADVNVPSATVSVLEHRKISAAEMMQTFYLQASATFNIYRRFKTGSAWGAWIQLLSLIPDRLGAIASTVTNANSALDSGFYRMVAGGSNMPVAANGTLVVTRYSSTEAAQTFVRTSNGDTYTRGYAASAFSAWQTDTPFNLANLETAILAMSAKTTLVDADVGILGDTAGTAGAGTYGKKFTMANLFVYISGKLGVWAAGLTAKATVVDADIIHVSDSAASSASKATTMTQLWANYLKGKADAVYAALVHTHVQSSITNLVTDLAAKAALASPALIGTPTAPTAGAGTNTTQLATTAFATTANNLKANLASPTFTGTVTVPTVAVTSSISAPILFFTGTSAFIDGTAAATRWWNHQNNAAILMDATGQINVVGTGMVLAGDVSAVHALLTSTTDVSLSSTGHAFQIGPTASTNLAFDVNEIMCRNNGGTNALNLNLDGGTVVLSSSANGATTDGFLTVGAPTGGNKGAGQINAKDVFNDNVALTCMPASQEFLHTGTIDLSVWDAMIPDDVIPEKIRRREVMFPPHTCTTSEVVDAEEDGILIRKHVTRIEVKDNVHAFTAEPVYGIVDVLIPIVERRGFKHVKVGQRKVGEKLAIIDAVKTYQYEDVVTPEQRTPRIHKTAHLFKAMLDSGFDPRDPEQYFAKWQAEEAIPGMPTRADYVHNSLSTAEFTNRQQLAADMMLIVQYMMWEKLKDHERRILALEGKSK